MKTKTNKTKSKAVHTIVRYVRPKEKSYPAFYLAVLLAAVLLLEGFLIGAATPAAWQEGMQILDLSRDVNVVMSDTFSVIEPLLVQIQSVETFYQLAATEAIIIFDSSYVDPLALPKGVIGFYEAASVEMAKMLDFSTALSYFPQVAGASISR